MRERVHAIRRCVLPAVLLAAAAPAGGTVTFTDVTVEAGLAVEQWPDSASSSLLCKELAVMSGGAAAGDYDRDGDVDLYLTRYEAPNLLFRNRGDGTFDEVAAAAGVALADLSAGCAWADVDGDGDLDLYVLTQEIVDGPGRNYLYLNDGGGQFTESAVARGADAGCADCAHAVTGVAFADYDRDGDLDFHLTEWAFAADFNRLYRNDGTGCFTDVTVAAGVAFSWPDSVLFGFANGFADMDDDGWPDLLVAGDFGTSRLLHNQGDGTFADVTGDPWTGVGTDENGMGSAIGDYDNDGDLDWFVTSIYDPDATCETELCNWGYSGNRLYRNAGGLVFFDETDTAGVRNGRWGWGTSFLDYDNDGDLDLAMTAGIDFPCPDQTVDDGFNQDPLRLWANDGGGVMTEMSVATGLVDDRSGKGLVVLDCDGDGDQDILVVNNRSTPALFRNDGGNTNAWLRVRLCGTGGNTAGIGARVFVETDSGGPVQMREVAANCNYLGQNEAVAHFGLGPGVSTVAHVRIRWPATGLETHLDDVPARQVLHVAEDGGPCGPPDPADVDGDGAVGVDDLVAVITAWGPCPPPCPADVDGDGEVDVDDLVAVILGWS